MGPWQACNYTKKGDLSKPGNYRGIMLLETAYKVLAIIIHNRLQPLVENIDHESQFGFRQGRCILCQTSTQKAQRTQLGNMGAFFRPC